MADLPTGPVTFLLTDVEGSTRLREEQPEAMRSPSPVTMRSSAAPSKRTEWENAPLS